MMSAEESFYAANDLSSGVFNLLKHVAQLINKQRVHSPPTVHLFQCADFGTYTEQI